MLHGNTAQVTLNQGISEEGNNSLKGDNKNKKCKLTCVQLYIPCIISEEGYNSLNLGENKIKSEGDKNFGSANLPVTDGIYHAECNVGLSAIHCNCIPDQSVSNYHHNIILSTQMSYGLLAPHVILAW